MKVHANAALGPAGRLALVRAIDGGMTQKAAAAAFCVAPATAHRWWHRWLSASPAERRSGSWVRDRSSRPRRQPRRLTAAEEGPIPRRSSTDPLRAAPARRDAAGRALNGRKVCSPETASRGCRAVRARATAAMSGLSPAPCFTSTSSASRALSAQGHAVTGERARRSRKVGWVYLHVVIDDHSRLVHVEQHPREDADTNAGCLERAIAEFKELGLAQPQAVMSDNAKVYGSRSFQAALERAGARHILTPPYTPRWNGKAERFIRTLQEEWAYAHTWATSTERTRALPSYIRYYNRRRPHSSWLGDRPPISRIHNLRGQDI